MDSSIHETHNPSGPRSVHLRRLLQQNKSKARSLQGFVGSVSRSVQLPLHPIHQQSRHHSFLQPLSLQGHHRLQEKPLWSSLHLFHVLHCLHHLQSQVLWVPQLWHPDRARRVFRAKLSRQTSPSWIHLSLSRTSWTCASNWHYCSSRGLFYSGGDGEVLCWSEGEGIWVTKSMHGCLCFSVSSLIGLLHLLQSSHSHRSQWVHSDCDWEERRGQHHHHATQGQVRVV